MSESQAPRSPQTAATLKEALIVELFGDVVDVVSQVEGLVSQVEGLSKSMKILHDSYPEMSKRAQLNLANTIKASGEEFKHSVTSMIEEVDQSAKLVDKSAKKFMILTFLMGITGGLVGGLIIGLALANNVFGG